MSGGKCGIVANGDRFSSGESAAVGTLVITAEDVLGESAGISLPAKSQAAEEKVLSVGVALDSRAHAMDAWNRGSE